MGKRGKKKKESLRSVEDRNKMALENEPLVHWATKKFYFIHPRVVAIYNRDDAYGDAWLGLLRACELFDPSTGYKFSSYAWFWMRQSMNRGLCKCVGIISIPEGVLKREKRIQPSHVLRASTMKIGDLELLNVVLDEKESIRKENRDVGESIQNALDKLHPHLSEIIKLRMKGYKLQDISELKGICRERVRQLEAQAHKKLLKLLCKYSEDM